MQLYYNVCNYSTLKEKSCSPSRAGEQLKRAQNETESFIMNSDRKVTESENSSENGKREAHHYKSTKNRQKKDASSKSCSNKCMEHLKLDPFKLKIAENEYEIRLLNKLILDMQCRIELDRQIEEKRRRDLEEKHTNIQLEQAMVSSEARNLKRVKVRDERHREFTQKYAEELRKQIDESRERRMNEVQRRKIEAAALHQEMLEIERKQREEEEQRKKHKKKLDEAIMKENQRLIQEKREEGLRYEYEDTHIRIHQHQDQNEESKDVPEEKTSHRRSRKQIEQMLEEEAQKEAVKLMREARTQTNGDHDHHHHKEVEFEDVSRSQRHRHQPIKMPEQQEKRSKSHERDQHRQHHHHQQPDEHDDREVASVDKPDIESEITSLDSEEIMRQHIIPIEREQSTKDEDVWKPKRHREKAHKKEKSRTNTEKTFEEQLIEKKKEEWAKILLEMKKQEAEDRHLEEQRRQQQRVLAADMERQMKEKRTQHELERQRSLEQRERRKTQESQREQLILAVKTKKLCELRKQGIPEHYIAEIDRKFDQMTCLGYHHRCRLFDNATASHIILGEMCD